MTMQKSATQQKIEAQLQRYSLTGNAEPDGGEFVLHEEHEGMLRRVEAQLQASIELLKQANRYVGTFASIGAQRLSIEVTEFVASVERNPVTGGEA